jgi:hypothetical protein
MVYRKGIGRLLLTGNSPLVPHQSIDVMLEPGASVRLNREILHGKLLPP